MVRRIIKEEKPLLAILDEVLTTICSELKKFYPPKLNLPINKWVNKLSSFLKKKYK